MAVYNIDGDTPAIVYGLQGDSLLQAYDIDGNPILDGGEPFIKTILPYDTNWIITSEWLANAESARDSIIALYEQSNDAIPFFIQTDGHGAFNEGNKGCHNLAEETMRYIANIQLGDYESFYYDGQNPLDHANSSEGITKYISAMGNHEFLTNNSDEAEIADLPTLIESYTPTDGVLGSSTYGFYKVLDYWKNVKYLVFQGHIPVAKSVDSGGFVFKMTGEQWEWVIDEMEADDGYDIVIINHEPFPGTYTHRPSGETFTWNPYGWKINLTPLLMARKAKESGTVTDGDGVVHSYDFTSCQTDLLCALYGHMHEEQYAPKTVFGFPTYTGDEYSIQKRACAYGLIDRDKGKLTIASFTKNAVNELLVLDL